MKKIKKYIKEILFDIKILFIYIIHGTKRAGDEILGFEGIDSDVDVVSKVGIGTVYDDLLNGRVTDEVRELRHKMYYIEKKSIEYENKNRKIDKRYKNLENSDGHDIEMVISNSNYNGNDESDPIFFSNYSIKFIYDFIPKYNFSEHVTQLIVKDYIDGKKILDIYVNRYNSQFGKTWKPFLNEMERIYCGNKRSPVIDFKEITFQRYDSESFDPYAKYKASNLIFSEIHDFDGHYVLRFICDLEKIDYGGMKEIYDEKTALKYENKESKNGTYELL